MKVIEFRIDFDFTSKNVSKSSDGLDPCISKQLFRLPRLSVLPSAIRRLSENYLQFLQVYHNISLIKVIMYSKGQIFPNGYLISPMQMRSL